MRKTIRKMEKKVKTMYKKKLRKSTKSKCVCMEVRQTTYDLIVHRPREIEDRIEMK